MAEPESVAPESDPIEPDKDAIAVRAYYLSGLSYAGTDPENWERARYQLRYERQMIAERAAQISQIRGSGGAVSDWLLAERELQGEIEAFRANWARVAYRDADISARSVTRRSIEHRAREISQSASAGSDEENWLRATRQIQAEHRLIAERAGNAMVGTPRWMRAEEELTNEGVIPVTEDIQ